jgi:hypothetical protein
MQNGEVVSKSSGWISMKFGTRDQHLKFLREFNFGSYLSIINPASHEVNFKLYWFS